MSGHFAEIFRLEIAAFVLELAELYLMRFRSLYLAKRLDDARVRFGMFFSHVFLDLGLDGLRKGTEGTLVLLLVHVHGLDMQL